MFSSNTLYTLFQYPGTTKQQTTAAVRNYIVTKLANSIGLMVYRLYTQCQRRVWASDDVVSVTEFRDDIPYGVCVCVCVWVMASECGSE